MKIDIVSDDLIPMDDTDTMPLGLNGRRMIRAWIDAVHGGNELVAKQWVLNHGNRGQALTPAQRETWSMTMQSLAGDWHSEQTKDEPISAVQLDAIGYYISCLRSVAGVLDRNPRAVEIKTQISNLEPAERIEMISMARRVVTKGDYSRWRTMWLIPCVPAFEAPRGQRPGQTATTATAEPFGEVDEDVRAALNAALSGNEPVVVSQFG